MTRSVSSIHDHFSRNFQLKILLFLLIPVMAKAQEESVLLTFRHPAIGAVYIGGLYDSRTEQTFLPLTGLFSLLEINYEADAGNFIVRGNFLAAGNPYVIDLSATKINLGKEEFNLTADDFRVAATDYFLSPKVFEKVFGLNFTVDIEHLTMTLETSANLPVQERKARERDRSQMGSSAMNQDFPLGYDRKYAFMSGAMLDYSIMGVYYNDAQSLSYTLTGGMELLGGDLQGTLTGTHDSYGFNDFYASNLRWRFGILNNKFISSFTAGQLSTTGLMSYAIRGVAVTNNPIEPRQMYTSRIIDGTTEPQSEVELYINDQLTDYQRADELGYYRFKIPMTYGTTRTSLRIFTPSGELKVVDRQMQVPYTFLPKGVITYNMQAGLAEPTLNMNPAEKYISHGDVAVGVSNWLTAKIGADHAGEAFTTGKFFGYGSLSARIASQYLLNLDIAPDAYYRLAGSVIYTNNVSMNFIYTRFDGYSPFNSNLALEAFSANLYLPFHFFGINTAFQLGGDHAVLPNSRSTRLIADLSAMVGRVNVRVNYRDNMVTTSESSYFGENNLTTSLTYTISRTPGIPVFVKGMFVRGQLIYRVRSNQVLTSELQISKTLFKTGRLNLSAAYNHVSHIVNAQLGFTLDLKPVRSTTTINSVNSSVSARQSFTGSIGLDAPHGHVDFSNRQQAGQAGADVILFVDNNNSGTCDKGDELLPCKGVKLDQSAVMKLGRDTILRLSQLQSYYRYNLSVVRNAIADPTVVPLKNDFSFIADPNQYKQIEIPFYRGGIIEGSVVLERNGNQSGQGGLRLLLKAVGKDYEQTVRTFEDGGFYTMDLAPGKYTLEVDPVQLNFMNAKQTGILEFEIKARSEGDYIEGLKILLKAE